MNKFKTYYKRIPSDYLLKASYQRTTDISRVNKMCREYNPNLVNPVKVSYRGGKYYIIDGAHTTAMLVQRNDNKDTLIFCKVFEGMTYEDEAQMFAAQNGLSRTVATAAKLKALYEAKEPNVLEFKKSVESAGVKCTFSSSGSGENNTLICYSTAYQIYKRSGAAYLSDLLALIKDIWNGEGESFVKEIIAGMDLFICAYTGEYSRKKLVERLQRVSPVTIRRDAKAMISGGNSRYAKQILNYYNKNTSSGRLPDRI